MHCRVRAADRQAPLDGVITDIVVLLKFHTNLRCLDAATARNGHRWTTTAESLSSRRPRLLIRGLNFLVNDVPDNIWKNVFTNRDYASIFILIRFLLLPILLHVLWVCKVLALMSFYHMCRYTGDHTWPHPNPNPTASRPQSGHRCKLSQMPCSYVQMIL